MGDDPPFLPVGTDVSAKYKGAFCEAKIKKVVRNIKCKVTLKAGGTVTVNDDVIKGTLRVGSTVEVKQDPKKDVMEAVITKIQDCSQYTVVFDDGDITTLRRSALCLKSGRHFNESETLDQLPLTHPEHFSTPVIAGRRGRRGRAQSEESEGESGGRPPKPESAEREPHVGRVVLVEAAGGAERRRPHQPAFPALVVAPTAQIKVKEDYLVRSFKDGRYYTVPKKEAREFRKGGAPLEWAGVEAALQYLNNGVLPPHWDRDSLFNEPRNTSDDNSSDDEPREEKDHFVAQLYKFMDDRGTPLNRNPTIANKDIDLYRLFRVVSKLGGYNRVTNQNQWKAIADKMGFHPVTTSITNLCKQAYKKFLHSFEDFYRKLGVTLVAHPRGARTPPAGRSLIRDRDKQPPTSSSASSTPTNTPTSSGTPSQVTRGPGPPSAAGPDTTSHTVTTRAKDSSDKSETDKSDRSEKEDKPEKPDKPPKEKPPPSDGEDSADNQPLAAAAPKLEKEKEKRSSSVSTSTTASDDKIVLKPRSHSGTRAAPPIKAEPRDTRTPKRRPLSSKSEGTPPGSSRASRRPHVSTDSDSSGRTSRCGLTKKMPCRRSQSANSASSGNTVASGSSKRQRKRKTTESGSLSTGGLSRSGRTNAKPQVGDKLKVFYGPTQSESEQMTYDAKVIEVSPEGALRVHYTGWNTRYDEWIKPQRIALNVTQHEATNKKSTNSTRRARAKRTEGSSARSDSDSDSDSEENVERPPQKPDEKSATRLSLRSKDAKSSDSSSSSKPRKRPLRTISTPTNGSPTKKTRANVHQGRDYDLNEIRSELKGLHTVKQEPEDIVTQEVVENEPTPGPSQNAAPAAEPPPPEKQAEDVYEFKEPEPFELEFHDEKKKRTHRIFDDILPNKYTITLSKSLSEEIAEDPLKPKPSTARSPNLSPFRDFGLSRDAPGRQSPEDDSKDGLFSLDDDSFPGDSSSGPIFEGFTPAKNQETYSKKSKVSKLRELIDDSPDSPADDEQSSEDEAKEVVSKEESKETSSVESAVEPPKTPSVVQEEPKLPEPAVEKEEINLVTEEEKIEIQPIEIEEPKTPPAQIKSESIDFPSTSNANTIPSPPKQLQTKLIPLQEKMEESQTEDEIELFSIPLPSSEPKEVVLSDPIESKIEPELDPTKIELPSSPIDTEEDKSEPDSPARLDVIPEPPPGFLLQAEGPKIAEKLLKAINSAKRLSMSPTPTEDRPDTPDRNVLGVITTEIKLSPVSSEPMPTIKTDSPKPLARANEPVGDSIFGEPPNLIELKRELLDIKKNKATESTSPRLQSPSSLLERRKSVADLPLAVPGKNNKVLSDTIQKLSSQINQSAANIPMPTFPTADRSESSDSDDSDRRLVIDKLSVEEWASGGSSEASRGLGTAAGAGGGAGQGAAVGAGVARGPHAGKSPGEWSAGESLLMLEDACKNERKHSASVVVAGSGRAVSGAGAGAAPAAGAGVAVAGLGSTEEDSNISLLLCEETIPGSPAPDAEPVPARQLLHMPFASAPQHHHSHQDERRDEMSARDEGVEAARAEGERDAAAAGQGAGAGGVDEGAAGAGAGAGAWGRRQALLDNTPPTTPDSSLDLSPQRERDSPMEPEPESHPNEPPASMDVDRPHSERRSRMASETSTAGGSGGASEAGAGPSRGRRRRRNSDDNMPFVSADRYNFLDFYLDPTWDSPRRIAVIMNQMEELKKAHTKLKAELVVIERRRKKLRRKGREAAKAARATL